MNESETRAGHFDPALKAAGWAVAAGSRLRRAVWRLEETFQKLEEALNDFMK